MNLDDLERDEQLALGGLIRLMIRSDGDFTEKEEEQVNDIGARMGGSEAIWKLISDSAQALPNDEEIRAAARGVARQEARRLILTVLREVSEGDGVAAEETALLEWLESSWAH